MGIRILVILFFLIFAECIFAEENALEEWKKFAKSKTAADVVEFIRCNATAEMNYKSCDSILPETPPFFGQLGIFITIVNKGKVRGCFGAFRHKNTQISKVK